MHSLEVALHDFDVAPDISNVRPEHLQQAQKKGDRHQKGYPLDGQDCDESRIHCVFLLANFGVYHSPGRPRLVFALLFLYNLKSG